MIVSFKDLVVLIDSSPPLFAILPPSFVYRIVLEEGHFCPNVFNGIHLRSSALVSILVSVERMCNLLEHAS